MSGWPTKALGDLCEITIGKTPPRNVPRYWGQGRAWLSIADMGQGKTLRRTKESITPAAVQDGVSGRLVTPGTVLLSFKLSIGKLGIAAVPLYTNEAIAALAIRDAAKLSPEYLLHALAAADLQARTDRAVMGNTLNKAKMQRLRVPLPPLPEQRRIAAILDKADAVRRKRQQTLDLADQFLCSAFLDMFGDPVTNPKGWPIRKLSDAFVTDRPPTKCGPFGSALRKEEHVNAGAPVLTMDNIAGDAFILRGCLFVTAEKAAALAQYEVQSGDIIVSRAGTVGKMCLVPELGTPAIISTNLIRLSLDPGVLEPSYFVAFMNFCRDWMGSLRTGADGAYSFMNTGVLERLRLPFPSVHAQRNWMRLRSTADKQAASLDQDVAVLADLASALARQAFRSEEASNDAGSAGGVR